MALVHVVTSEKGGAGKTTAVMNLAAVLGDTLGPDKVLVVSTDQQNSVAYWRNRAEMTARRTAARLAEKQGTPPPPADEPIDDGLPFDTYELSSIEEIALLARQDHYQHVFVDTPGNLAAVEVVTTTLDYADDVIVPMEDAGLAEEPTERTVEKVVKPRGIPYTVFVNKWDASRAGGAAGPERRWQFIDDHGWPRSQRAIRLYRLHAEAAEHGMVCTQYRASRVAQSAREDFLRLAIDLGLARNGGR